MKQFDTKSAGFNQDDYAVVDVIAKIPHKILTHRELSGLAHMVLHDLGHENAFGLTKAAYFVDNPDFDKFMGVAGFCKNECHQHKENHWQAPELFKEDMKQAEFNNNVKAFSSQSFNKKHADTYNVQDIIQLGKDLGISNPSFFSWKKHHGNHGLLIFEPSKEFSAWRHSLLSNIVALLSLCGRH